MKPLLDTTDLAAFSCRWLFLGTAVGYVAMLFFGLPIWCVS